jgi:hypothetical protein
MISRRTLLAGAAGIAAAGVWRYATTSEEDAIAAVVRRRLDYLSLDDEGLREFARDLANHGVVADGKLHMIAAVGPVYPLIATVPAAAQLLKHGEERIVSLYLLSSDFFVNGADEARRVRYLRFYDPIGQARACANPFARSVVS